MSTSTISTSRAHLPHCISIQIPKTLFELTWASELITNGGLGRYWSSRRSKLLGNMSSNIRPCRSPPAWLVFLAPPRPLLVPRKVTIALSLTPASRYGGHRRSRPIWPTMANLGETGTIQTPSPVERASVFEREKRDRSAKCA
jgi:hypothetical protein